MTTPNLLLSAIARSPEALRLHCRVSFWSGIVPSLQVETNEDVGILGRSRPPKSADEQRSGMNPYRDRLRYRIEGLRIKTPVRQLVMLYYTCRHMTQFEISILIETSDPHLPVDQFWATPRIPASKNEAFQDFPRFQVITLFVGRLFRPMGRQKL